MYIFVVSETRIKFFHLKNVRHRVPVQFYLTNSRVHWEKWVVHLLTILYWISTTGQPKKKRILLLFFCVSGWNKIERHATKEDERKTEKATKRKYSFGLSIGRLHIAALCVFIWSSTAYHFSVSWSAFSNKKRCERFMVPIRWIDLVFALRK